MDTQWQNWMSAAWPQLVAGERLLAPTYLAHPQWSGFEKTELAEPAGQIDDWVVSMTDGSRVHVHENADGSMVVHRDAVDPSRGLIEAFVHTVTESNWLKAVAGLALLFLVIGGIGEALSSKR